MSPAYPSRDLHVVTSHVEFDDDNDCCELYDSMLFDEEPEERCHTPPAPAVEQPPPAHADAGGSNEVLSDETYNWLRTSIHELVFCDGKASSVQQQVVELKRGFHPTIPSIHHFAQLLSETFPDRAVSIREAKGSANKSTCLTRPRHESLTLSRSSATIPSPSSPFHHDDTLIIEIAFRDSFTIPEPTPRYQAILDLLPEVYAATTTHFTATVAFLADEIARSFKAQRMVLPPWRSFSALHSRWSPNTTVDTLVSQPMPPRLPVSHPLSLSPLPAPALAPPPPARQQSPPLPPLANVRVTSNLAPKPLKVTGLKELLDIPTYSPRGAKRRPQPLNLFPTNPPPAPLSNLRPPPSQRPPPSSKPPPPSSKPQGPVSHPCLPVPHLPPPSTQRPAPSPQPPASSQPPRSTTASTHRPATTQLTFPPWSSRAPGQTTSICGWPRLAPAAAQPLPPPPKPTAPHIPTSTLRPTRMAAGPTSASPAATTVPEQPATAAPLAAGLAPTTAPAAAAAGQRAAALAPDLVAAAGQEVMAALRGNRLGPSPAQHYSTIAAGFSHHSYSSPIRPAHRRTAAASHTTGSAAAQLPDPFGKHPTASCKEWQGPPAGPEARTPAAPGPAPFEAEELPASVPTDQQQGAAAVENLGAAVAQAAAPAAELPSAASEPDADSALPAAVAACELATAQGDAGAGQVPAAAGKQPESWAAAAQAPAGAGKLAAQPRRLGHASIQDMLLPVKKVKLGYVHAFC